MNARSNASELQEIVNDYSFLEDENLALKDEARSAKATINDLDRSNRELTERLEKITGERDKLQAFSINLVTRLHVISENVENIVKEAGRSAIAEAGRLREGREVQDRIGVHPVRRAAAEAAQRVPIHVAAETRQPAPSHPLAPGTKTTLPHNAYE